MKYSLLTIVTLCFFLVSEPIRILSQMGEDSIVFPGGTFIMLGFMIISVLIFSYLPFYNKNRFDKWIRLFFFSWLGWCAFNLVRGAFLAKDYWDYKFLLFSSLGFVSISLVFYIGLNLQVVIKLLRFFIRFYLVICFVYLPIALQTDLELYPRMVLPISIFILFIPYIPPKSKVLVILVTVLSMTLVLGFRIHIIKCFLSILFLGLYYFRRIVPLNLIRLVHLLLFAGPIIIFLLGITGNYNIFKELEDQQGYETIDQDGKNENLAADTRTFLYFEVISSVLKSGNILIGEGASGKYESEYFDLLEDGRGRYGSEVGILNIFLYFGIIGVLIFLLLLAVVSYKAIYKSNNMLSKMLGLLIASRWSLSFIEEWHQYNLNFFFFWLVLGLISNELFLKMNEEQIKRILH